MSNSDGSGTFGLSIPAVLGSLAMIVGLVVVGTWVMSGGETDTPVAADPAQDAPALVAADDGVPRLPPPATYTPKDNTIEIEISEYAGYAGLVAANGGLAPNPDSWFAKNAGFSVKLTLSEEDAWGSVNSGRIAGSVTTVDVLPLYGRQLDVVVPVQIGFSRGADAIVVREGIQRLNDLRGKVLVAQQFGESEFFLRYLAQETNIPVVTVDTPVAAKPDAINIAFAEDAFAAGDVFAGDDSGAFAGCVTWEPKTSEVVKNSAGKARVLASNRNLLVIADILMLNRGFAEKNPAMVRGLVEGLLVGNALVRDTPDRAIPTVARAFQWSEAETRTQLAAVHLSNLPENVAFFSGEIDMAGSYSGIFQSSVLAYGRDIVRDATNPERFLNLTALEALKTDSRFVGQSIAIAPIRVQGAGAVEDDPLLSKDIRFLFEPNSSKLDMTSAENLENLKALKRLLTVSPGSTLVLRGHVDDGQRKEFRKSGGDSFVREMALKAVALSTERAKEVERQLVLIERVDESRVEPVGIGWDQPVSATNPELNRRVEAQWFTLE
jgi:NitT/TauT family transport system substrate-binding protein